MRRRGILSGPYMGLREELGKRIERKQQEIKELELKIREGYAYMQGLQDTLKLLPKDDGQPQEVVLRPGTDMAKAQEAIRAIGHALHINDLLKALGKPIDKKNRLALGGSLARYARKNVVFRKTGPNTFGLADVAAQRRDGGQEPPNDFGLPEG